MKGIDYWRFSRELEIYQAVFLILGLDPSDDRDSRYGMDFSVDGYQAMKQVLNQAIERDIIIANEGLLEVDSIKKWLKQEEFYPDFFFPKENTAHETAENLEDEWVCSLPPKPETPDYLNSQHSYYAPKLAAAVKAWQAVADNKEALRGKPLNKPWNIGWKRTLRTSG